MRVSIHTFKYRDIEMSLNTHYSEGMGVLIPVLSFIAV